jgi:hypothetical protein
MHLVEKMSPALSTRVNSFNFILNERGGILARLVAAGVRMWNASKGQELQEFENIPDISAINFFNRGALSVDKEPGIFPEN